MADISIPEGDNPVRYQASLGGNQKYRNMGNVSGQAYLVRGQVTNVYYQKGTLDFNTYGSSVTSGVTDGSGSAPIPVDFWGKNTDGKVFGCYRPVQKGSQILVAYIGGDTSRPIVIGVYPDNEASYELISPVHYNTGDDSTDDVQNDALGERKIYPNQQMMYESGKGDILRSMGGKSFLYISENGSGYLDDINYAYDEIRDFYDADANEIEPTMTKAQSWLLVHEDNESDEASDGHRTRFYVNRSGELMVTFANKDDPNNIVVLEASKDSGFKLTKRFDNSNIKEDSEDYVQFGIGNGNNVSIKSVDSGDATSFYLDNGNIKLDTPKEGSITFDGISVNAILGRVSDAENAANNASDKADNAAIAGERAESAASDAASQALAASQAGEDAKSAAVEAQAAGEDAKTQAEDTRNRIIYYSSISNEKDVAIPGKYIIVNTDTYIKNGTIKTAHIGDGAITNAKIANLAVGTAQIEDGAITHAKIGNLAVGTAEIENAAITDAKVGDLSADKLTAGTIDFHTITGKNINASNITTGTLDANRLNVDKLSALSADLGDVTTGSLKGIGISASTINSSTINAGSINTNANNTAKFYPFTAGSDGVLRSYHVDDYFANYARMYSGTIVISDRNMATTDGNKYGGETAVIGGASIILSSGYTVGKDTDFSKPLVSDGDGTTQLILSGVTGIALNGSNQSVTFKGTSSTGTNGIRMDSYGNVHGEGTSSWWRVYDSSGNQVANFGTAPGNNVTFPKPIFTDEIGALSSSNDGRILIHDLKGDAQMIFSNDGNPRVSSYTIYNRTYSSGSNVYITSYGTIGRSTSASKYKLDITKETSLAPANKLLSIDRSSWVDKNSAEMLADSKKNGTELSEPEINVFRHYGLIAEDLIKAGLDEFVIKGDKGQAEGIEYDRLWTVLIPKIRQLSNDQIQNKMTISKLESEIEELRQGRYIKYECNSNHRKQPTSRWDMEGKL